MKKNSNKMESNLQSGILAIDEGIEKDESIEKYEYHEYSPVTGTSNLNNGGEIRIVIESQDLFTHPSESYLIIEGQLTKVDGTVYANADLVSIINNGIMYLFKFLKYELSGQEIEQINYPGQASTMLGLLKYPDDFSKSKGLNQCWYKDSNVNAALNNEGFGKRHVYLINSPNPKGTFSFKIPLNHIFGFAEDYNKVIFGFKHQLTLYRSQDDNDAIFRDAAVDAGKINLTNVSWFVPHVLPSDIPKLSLYKKIESKIKFDVLFRRRQIDSFTVPQSTNFTWRLSVQSSPEKPRWIIIGFQTDKENDQERNPAIFDNVNVKDIYVNLNNRKYPEVSYNLSFPQQQFSRAYGDAADFRAKYYNLDEICSNSNINPMDYKTLYPLFVFDVSKQSERLKSSITDIHIKALFNANPPANTQVYALVISDKIFKFQSDGNKLNVIQ